MKIFVGIEKEIESFYPKIEQLLLNHSTEVEIVSANSSSKLGFQVASKVISDHENESIGICLSKNGAGCFNGANKVSSAICAQVFDEHSARMTRDHNNTKVIAISLDVIGEALAISIIDKFIQGEYSAGRHQIRIDMLSKLLVEER